MHSRSAACDFLRLLNFSLFCRSPYRDNVLHKAVDLVCDDYGIVNAPFSGSLAGPVRQTDPVGTQYDGVKFLSDGKMSKVNTLHETVEANDKIHVFWRDCLLNRGHSFLLSCSENCIF